MTGNIPKEWKKALKGAGVKRKDLLRVETAALVYQIIVDHFYHGNETQYGPHHPITKLVTGNIPKEWKKALKGTGVKRKDLFHVETAELVWQMFLRDKFG